MKLNPIAWAYSLYQKGQDLYEKRDANVMAGVLGVLFMGFGALMLFVLGGIVAPGLYQMSTDALNITDATALAMRSASATNMQQIFQVVGMVMMILGFIMIIAQLWGTIPFFGGRQKGGM